MAETIAEENLIPNIVVSGEFFKSSVGQSSLPEKSIFGNKVHKIARRMVAVQFDLGHIDLREIGTSQNSFSQIGTSQDSFSQIGTSQIGISQISVPQVSSSQIGTSQIRPAKICHTKTASDQISTNHFGTAQVGFSEVEISKISSTQDNIAQVDLTKRRTRSVPAPKSNTSEISFASSISFKQFFSSHNSTPQIIDVLNNSATKIWSDLLQTKTQLDIDFQITNLPSGQLAEATIIDFDDTRNSNAGTILIDHDANGVGWFIDPTPSDNSEFIPQNTDTYLLAAAESEAHGKYDMTTIVLCKIAHFYRFIDGYSRFNGFVDVKNLKSDLLFDKITAYGKRTDSRTIEEWQHKAIWSLIMFSL